MYNLVLEVLARCRRGEQFKVCAQPMSEIVADVLHHFLFCRGRETRHGHGAGALLVLLIFLYEFADVEIVYTEVLSPGGEAVCLVNDEPDHMASHEYALDGVGPQHLWRDVEQ